MAVTHASRCKKGFAIVRLVDIVVLYLSQPQPLKPHHHPVRPTEEMEHEARSHERCQYARDAPAERLLDAEAAARLGVQTNVVARHKASEQRWRHNGSARGKKAQEAQGGLQFLSIARK